MTRTVIDDYKRLMRLGCYQTFLPKENETALKINVSWHYFYPACSTTPWQLDGVITTLLEDGDAKEKLYGCHNRTVLVSAKRGELVDKHKQVVVDKYGLRNVHLYEPGEQWIWYTPTAKMRVLDKVYPEGIRIPRRLIGSNIIHLPTIEDPRFHRDHRGDEECFFIRGCSRSWTAPSPGDGPGPRCMVPLVKNYIRASGDMVAIDAIAAKMMGFDPLSIPFIRMAHEQGLGCGDVREIEVVGEDIAAVNFHFDVGDTFASHGQKLIYRGPLKPLEHSLLRTVIAPWPYAASILYHDVFWYNFVGRARVRQALQTDWGKLVESYGGG